MIRDPSDGSVKGQERTELDSPQMSGLPPVTKNADQLARLERDREWLKNYLHRKTEGK